ncbi:hypothetical protein CDAR_49601 [Caerostris darwini]|uniref:Uncharacterized protein n=1 Tax=Caerostris darwini TaxID=1538125 RepID=A0AAV4T717_9ARAC|nr:hypothetical protein CDAR_49601 [Caerostris darwini]
MDGLPWQECRLLCWYSEATDDFPPESSGLTGFGIISLAGFLLLHSLMLVNDALVMTEDGPPRTVPRWQECRLLSGIRERQMIFPRDRQSLQDLASFLLPDFCCCSAVAQTDAR